MKNSPDLYDTLLELFGQYGHWLDIRHLHTLAWIVVGLIRSKTIALPEWAVFVTSRAHYLQSTVRRFSRWLHNERIQVTQLYAPIIQDVLMAWQGKTLYLALDTTMLWDRFCHIRISLIYRGRAIPLAWKTLEHNSNMVAFAVYRELLDTTAALLPANATVVLLADRGFADTQLMRYLHQQLHWHWRIRIKKSMFVFRRGQRKIKIGHASLRRGQALFWHKVYLTEARFGPVHLAIGKPLGSKETWFIVSDQPTDLHTFTEYGLRFDIEEGFLDDKSNGFQLEASLFRSAEAVSRLCLALAVATLFLVSQGVEVVRNNRRRWVDAHWFRGHSYLKIGWKWVLRALVVGWKLVARLYLSPEPDPEPAMASQEWKKKQQRKRFSSTSTTVFSPYPARSA